MTDSLREELLRVKARESRYKKEARERIACLEERVASLEAELASATEKAEVAADEAGKRIIELEGLLSDASARDEAAQREIAEARDQLAKTKTDLEAATNLIKSRELEFEARKSEADEDAASALASLREELDRQKKEHAFLRQMLDEADNENARHKVALAKSAGEIADAQKKIAELTANLDKARGDLESASALIKAREKEFAEVAEKGSRYKARVAERIASLEKELGESKKEIARLKSLLEQAKRAASGAEGVIDKQLQPLKDKLVAALATALSWKATFNKLEDVFSTFFSHNLDRDGIRRLHSQIDSHRSVFYAIIRDRESFALFRKAGELTRISQAANSLVLSMLAELNRLTDLQSGPYSKALSAAKTRLLQQIEGIAKLKKELESTDAKSL